MILALLAIAAAALPSGGEELPARLGPHSFDTWQRQQGLPQITVNAIAQDDRRYLWVGTLDGLARFDGQRFEVFDNDNTPQLQSDEIRALLLGRDGGLWIATRRGLNRYRYGRFTLFTTADGLPDDDLRSLCEDRDGALWIGTAKGLARFSGGAFTTYSTRDGLVHDSVRVIYEARSDGLWIGTDGGLSRLADGGFTTYASGDGLPDDHVRAIHQDRRGRLWIGTVNGLARFAGGRFEPITEGLAHPTVSAFVEDRQGRLWIATDGGLNRTDGDRLATHTFGDAVAVNRVRALWEDHEGSLWIGVGLLGLVRLRHQTATNVGVSEGLADDLVWAVVEDRAGDVWVGTNRGLTRFHAGRGSRSYDVADGLPGEDVRALRPGRRGVWIGTETGGVARIAGGEIEVIRAGDQSASPGVLALIEDSGGDLWAGTAAGLERFGDGGRLVYSTADGLPHEHIWSLLEDGGGGLWIGTAAGLARFDEGAIAAVAAPQLGGDVIKTLHQDRRGDLWIGTADSGLVRYREGEVVRYSTADGLFDDGIHHILEDHRGWMWMSSNQGVFRVEMSDLEDFADGKLDGVRSLSFSEADGMASRECNGSGHPAGYVTSDGKLWFPTIRGVTIFDPESPSEELPPPTVYVEEVLVDRLPVTGEDAGAGGGGARRAEAVSGIKELELRYAAVSLLNPGLVRYRYLLDGFDREWVEAGTDRTAKYTNLAPGNYRFRVIASSGGSGLWSTAVDQVEIVVRPAFYQTTTFVVLCAVALALVGAGLYRLHVHRVLHRDRLRMLEEKNAEMERLIYTVSHDLRSPLVTVKGFLGYLEKDLAGGREDKVEQDLDHIRTATDQMGRLLEELSELARAGRKVHEPEEVELGELAREAVDLVAGAITEGGIEVTVADDLPVVTGDRSRLLRLLQNLIDNAVKFLGDQPQPRIEIGARRPGEETEIYVRDNGIGIDPEDQDRVFGLFDRLDDQVPGSGIGLALVQRIVESHGGRIWVESRGRGHGTTFCFVLPLS